MTKHTLKVAFIGGLMSIAVLALAACQAATPTIAPDQPPTQPQPTQQVVATPTACPLPVTGGICADLPFSEAWQNSPHADASAEAFVHWDEEDPPEVPANCAKCHSKGGFLDYVGADGSQAFSVDSPAETGTVIDCATCHNAATEGLSTVIFPSGVELTNVGNDAVCLTCHQGTASEAQVNASIEAAGLTGEDEVSPDLGFTNIHYYTAAVSRYGTVVNGGYQYDGKSYDALFEHAAGISECTDCHDSHSLEVRVELCAECHEGADSLEGVREIRYLSSLHDYDGDGDIEEGIPFEIEGLQEVLLAVMQGYAANVSGTPIAYNSQAYPYFFIDTNANGQLDDDEANVPNRFNAWTPRLAKAAFNYQTSIKDPGGYAHGGKYIIQLLYDSIEDLNAALGANAVDIPVLTRTDPGHFDGSAEAFRHWDADGAVPASCAKCHAAEGLPQFITEGANLSLAPSNGLLCESCHSSLTEFTFYEVEEVRFPSGAVLGFEDEPAANLCLNCHQGRESTTSVNARLQNAPDDEILEGLNFINVHYFAAGATLFGTEAKGVYEYEGQTYAGRFTHLPNFDSCAECHDAHALEVEANACIGCHNTAPTARDIRLNLTEDYDGDGDAEEGLYYEIETMRDALYAAIQAYAADTLGTPLIYSAASHPYFFIDTNENGEVDEGEAVRDNSFPGWSPRLLRAAYNFQYALKDPGAYAHNAEYILQVLYDSLRDIGGDDAVSGMTRP